MSTTLATGPSLEVTVLLCLLVQAGAALVLSLKVADSPMSILGLFSAVWVVYFPLRLAMLTFSRPSPHFYMQVNAISDSALSTQSLVLTIAFVSFVLGAALCGTKKRFDAVRGPTLTYSRFLVIGVFGFAVNLVTLLIGASSGLASNVGSLTLFGVAGASFIETRALGRGHYAAVLAIAAATLGYRTGFKEAALLPVASWLIGRAAAGQRVRIRYVVASGLAVTLAFAAVQGQRATGARQGEQPSAARLVVIGLTEIDLSTGAPENSTGLGIVRNVVNGTLFRLKGADYFIVVADMVPRVVPFQGGRSLWQPALSVVPGGQMLFDLSPEFGQLSLGRFVTTTLTSPGQASNTSSQSLTFPGDLYLNFGSAGVIFGLFALGVLFGRIDRAIGRRGAVSAGLLALLGTALVAVDRNVAYVLVTAGIRLTLILAVLYFLWGRSFTEMRYIHA